MTVKQVLFRADAREKVLRGAAALADAVRITLGPKSKSVLIQKKWGTPLVCNDGVTIAKEMELEDPEENLGAQMLRQAAEKTGDAVGDGTSTATILAHAIYAEGVRNVAAGASAIDLKRGLDRGLEAAVKCAHEPGEARRQPQGKGAGRDHFGAQRSRPSASWSPTRWRRWVATGSITVEESKTTETTLDVVEGMQFDRGYLSPYFVTDPSTMEAVLEDAYVLICDRKLNMLKDIIPLLEQVAKSGRPILFVAEDIEGEALATLIVNQIRGVLKNAAVKAPGFGDRRKAMLRGHRDADGRTADLRGARIQARGRRRSSSSGVHSVWSSTRTRRRSSAAPANKAAIEGRMQMIRKEIDKTTSDYDREKLEERLAKLSGGVAVIRVGAPSESEMKSKKDALDDAISSTKAAVAEGIVAGGGLALLRVCPALDALEAQLQRRRAHRRADSAARARGADAPDRRELVGRWRRRGGPHAEREQRQRRLRRRAQGVRRPLRGWHRRSRRRSCAWRSRTRSRSRACCC